MQSIFEHHRFECRSSGSPANRVGVPEVSRFDESQYSTQLVGAGWGEVIVICRDTGKKDALSRTIWITPENISFVFEYQPETQDCFDYGALVAPTKV